MSFSAKKEIQQKFVKLSLQDESQLEEQQNLQIAAERVGKTDNAFRGQILGQISVPFPCPRSIYFPPNSENHSPKNENLKK